MFGFHRVTISPADCPNMKYLLIFATLVCIEFYNCDAGIDIGNQVRKHLKKNMSNSAIMALLFLKVKKAIEVIIRCGLVLHPTVPIWNNSLQLPQ